MITLTPLAASDADELLSFELQNRDYFAAHVPDRPPQYFDLAWLRDFLTALEAEQARGESLMYLARTAQGELVGRVNLTDINATTANLGYRIGGAHTGKGYATEAVRLGLEAAKSTGIAAIRAMTTINNKGSQAVLLKNGFTIIPGEPAALDVNGTAHEAVHFIKQLA